MQMDKNVRNTERAPHMYRIYPSLTHWPIFPKPLQGEPLTWRRHGMLQVPQAPFPFHWICDYSMDQ